MTSVDKVQTAKEMRAAKVKKMKLDAKVDYQRRQEASTSYVKRGLIARLVIARQG